jgi:hypothetical protein
LPLLFQVPVSSLSVLGFENLQAFRTLKSVPCSGSNTPSASGHQIISTALRYSKRFNNLRSF